MHILIVIALTLALGGGVGLAAQNAQPGDALYTVKTHLNDNVGATFSAVADTFVGNGDAEEETSTNAEASANARVDGNVEAQGALDATVSTDIETGLRATIR